MPLIDTDLVVRYYLDEAASGTTPTEAEDKSDVGYYIGDIGEFDNGDIFILKMEEWLEVYVEWIGEPNCEDQSRDLYRISEAKIIGNSFLFNIVV